MQNKYLKTLFTSFIILLLMAFKHEYYVSVFEMEYNKVDQKIECSIKVFSNDFERVLQDLTAKNVELENTEQKIILDSLIERYLENNLSVKQKENSKTINYLGFEYKRDDTFIYFSANNIEPKIDIEITNTWFKNKFHHQVNILHFKNGAQKQTFYFKEEQWSKALKLE